MKRLGVLVRLRVRRIANVLGGRGNHPANFLDAYLLPAVGWALGPGEANELSPERGYFFKCHGCILACRARRYTLLWPDFRYVVNVVK
jgi:hypothetical protein